MKKIPIQRLKVGMYISDINSDYMSHPFFRNKFIVKDAATLKKIIDAGIHEVYIDPSKGLDDKDAPTVSENRKELKDSLKNIAKVTAGDKNNVSGKVAFSEEIGRARKTYGEAVKIISDIMLDVRLGKQADLAKAEPAVMKISESVVKCPDALLSLCRVKKKDYYTFSHSVSVCALLIAFCHHEGFSDSEIYDVGIGGLLHDIGKIKISDNILNKQGVLSENEFTLMKNHVSEGRRILERASGFSESSILIEFQHHERFDGSGYPMGAKGSEISVLGRMASICDVYDAITSERVYHKGLDPNEALGRIFEWSKFHFDRKLVEHFVCAIGIYPVGTLVLLDSGFIGVVAEQRKKNLIRPLVILIYDSKKGIYIEPQPLDLIDTSGDNIASAVPMGKLNINPLTFLS